jgi:AraC-like DNA-binding protein
MSRILSTTIQLGVFILLTLLVETPTFADSMKSSTTLVRNTDTNKWLPLLNEANSLIQQRQIKKALNTTKLADSLYRLEHHSPLSDIQAALAICYRDNGNLPQAIIHYQIAIDCAPDSLSRINMIFNMAEISLIAGDTLGVAYHIKECRAFIHRLEGHERQGYFLNVLGNYLNALHYPLREVQTTYLKSVEASRRAGEFETAGFACEGLVQLYLETSQNDSCLLWLDSVIHYQYRANTPLGLSSAYLCVGRVKNSMGDFQEAFKAYSEALPHVREADYTPFLKDNLQQLSNLANQIGNHELGYKYLNEYQALIDSIEEAEWKNHLSDLHFQYEYPHIHKKLEQVEYRKSQLTWFLYLSIFFFIGGAVALSLLILRRTNKNKLQANANSDKLQPECKPDRIISCEKIQLWEYLQTAMSEQHIFTDPDLTLTTLAQKLNTNRSTLSEVINAQSGKSFNHYINDFRVAWSCKLLKDPNKAHLSIEGISLDSGFKTRSSFYSAFSAVYNISPAKYRKDNLLEVVQIDPCGQQPLS